MRALITTVVIIVLIVLLAPWIDGLCFKRSFFNTIAAINKHHRVKVDVLAYDTGWFHSTAKLRVTPSAAMAPPNGDNINFMIDSRITHGPFVCNKITNNFTVAFATMISNIQINHPDLKSKPTVQMKSLSSFGGTWYNHVIVPNVAITEPNEVNLNWQGLTADINFKVHNERIRSNDIKVKSGNLILNPLAKDENVKQIQVKGINYRHWSDQTIADLWNGTSLLFIPNITVTKSDGIKLVLVDFHANSVYGSKGELYNIAWDVAAHRVETGTQIIPTISPAMLSFKASNLNAQAMQNLIRYIKESHNKHMSAENLQASSMIFLNLITPTTTITKDIVLNTSAGNLNASAKIYWSANVPLPKTIADVLQNSNFSLNVTAATSLVDKLMNYYGDQYGSTVTPAPTTSQPVTQNTNQTNTTIALPNTTQPMQKTNAAKQTFDTLMQKGFIVKQGNNYVIQISRENGVYNINGHKVNSLLPNLTGQPIQAPSSPPAQTPPMPAAHP